MKLTECELSMRAVACLDRAGITTTTQARQAIRKGLLVPQVRPLDYGWKTHNELCQLLGIPSVRGANRLEKQLNHIEDMIAGLQAKRSILRATLRLYNASKLKAPIGKVISTDDLRALAFREVILEGLPVARLARRLGIRKSVAIRAVHEGAMHTNIEWYRGVAVKTPDKDPTIISLRLWKHLLFT